MSGLSLAAFRPRVVTVTITDESRELLEVNLSALTWAEYHEIGQTVPDPMAPVERDFVDGKIVERAVTESDEYRSAVYAAQMERQHRRLAIALIRAGNLAELADRPLEEQSAAVQQMDAGIVAALLRALTQLTLENQEVIRHQAENFHAVSTAAATDLPCERLESDTVAQSK